MTTIFIVCGDSLRGNAGQRSMRESNRCDGAQCAHQFFENARPHRVARTRSCSLSPAFSVLNFYSYAFFLQKSLLLLLLFWSLLSGFLTIRMFRPRL